MRKLENVVWYFVRNMYISKRIPKKFTDKVYDIFYVPIRKFNDKG
jgi:hypothetical protein